MQTVKSPAQIIGAPHPGYGRRTTSLCKAVMMRIGILPHTYNFQGIYPFSHLDTVGEALVFPAQLLKRCVTTSE